MIKSLSQNGNKTIGESIKDLRIARGLSIKDLADQAGVTPAAVSRWESGKRVPTVENYNKLITALGAELTVVEK